MSWRVAVDPYARKVGLYTAYPIKESEYVGSVDPYELDVEAYLRDNGYEDDPTFLGIRLSADKTRREMVQCLFIRKVNPHNPKRQWHVHAWVVSSSELRIYSHEEYRADFERIEDESLSDVYDRLRTHFRPGETYIQGAADKAVQELTQ